MSIEYLLDGYNVMHSAAMERLLTARKFSAAQQRRNDERSEEFSCQMPEPSPAGLDDRRRRLIRFIEQYRPQGSDKNTVTVIFDSIGKYKERMLLENSFPMQQRGDDERSEEFSCGKLESFGGMVSPSVRIIFSQGESADDKIKKIVAQAKNKKSMIVVTDDRDIQYAVRALGAKTSGVKAFLLQGNGPGQSRPGKDSSAVSEKVISKRDESKITSEMKEIWLKPGKKRGH